MGMEKSNSETPDHENCECLKLEEDDSSRIEKSKNQYVVPQESSSWWPPENSLHRNIWGGRFFFYTQGPELVSNPQIDYFDQFKWDNFEFGSSSQQPTMKPFRNSPSTSNCLSNPVFSQDLRFRHMVHYNDHDNDQFSEQANNGLCYGSTNNCYQQQVDALPNDDYGFSMDIPKGGDYQQIETIYLTSRPSYLLMMVDKEMSIVFQKLLDVCTTEHLNSIAQEVLSTNDMFVEAAFSKYGLLSIIKLMKRVKRSFHAYRVTQILSTQFCRIMTDYKAKDVIQRCFMYFGDEPNEILHHEAKQHFQELATHKVGCRAVNEIINMMNGRSNDLLNLVADHSAYLAHDEYGNFVVQNALTLNKRDINRRIVSKLRGEFVELAKETRGSHVVEKCMQCSELGLVTVVEEILENQISPILLALDYFGNYVIQTALRKTKNYGLSGLYYSLEKLLLPYHEVLNTTPGGKNVLSIIEGDHRLIEANFDLMERQCGQVYGAECKE